ncbi:MAG: hypothetical protein LQ346_008610 [Caloplaca aetnensis]|nr:MAG: hypothetical protein LQ346_008610 [Caloplaca aetnensis]
MSQLYVQAAPLYRIPQELRENCRFHRDEAGHAIHFQLYPPSLQRKLLATGLALIIYGVHMGSATLRERYVNPQTTQTSAVRDKVPLNEGWTVVETPAGISGPDIDKQKTEKQTRGNEAIQTPPDHHHQPNDQHCVVPPLPQMAIVTIGARLWKISQIFLVAVGVLLMLAFHLVGGEFRPDGSLLVAIVIGQILGFFIPRALTATVKYRSNVARIPPLDREEVGCGTDKPAQAQGHEDVCVARA